MSSPAGGMVVRKGADYLAITSIVGPLDATLLPKISLVFCRSDFSNTIEPLRTLRDPRTVIPGHR